MKNHQGKDGKGKQTPCVFFLGVQQERRASETQRKEQKDGSGASV